MCNCVADELARLSTPDEDNDSSYVNDCSAIYGAGWWFEGDKGCYDANLNGKYRQGKTSSKDSITWIDGETLKFVEMKIRPASYMP